MPNENKCPQCGASLAAGAPEGLCPACLLKQGATADSGTQPESPAFEPPPVSEVARLFPNLEILGLIGKGGMGAVYKARQPSLDRLVALKILPPQTGSEAGFAERFNREARALARLNHPNIVAVHEFGQISGLHYFIMEYVDGANLRQLEQAGRLSPREAMQIVPQICDALQYAHDEGVVHRDIKPENMLVDRKGRVKIADFGLAKILGREPSTLRLTDAGQVMGTPHYMAPEQVERPLAVDHRADIYSLGVVFYEMLTGELPLGKFPPPSRKVQVDVRLDEVVLRALEKEPERRYQQASQVKSDVETIASKPPPAPPEAATAVLSGTPEMERARQQVKGPAIGLFVTGALNWIIIPLAVLILLPALSKTRGMEGGPAVMTLLVLVVLVSPFVLCTLILVGALKMMRLEAYGLAVAAGIFALVVTPGNIIGFPLGIWALVTLARREVREAFRQNRAGATPPAKGRKRWWLLGLLAVGAVATALAVFLWSGQPNVQVQGVVTDASTGKPIAGARVADHIFAAGANKKAREAWTDAQGRFSLETWPEEHTLAASAPGYEQKLVTFPTKLFGQERQMRMNIHLEPAGKAEGFAANLPGRRIELVGVSSPDSAGEGWWRPDGRPLDRVDFELGGAPPRGEAFRVFVVRISGWAADAPEPEFGAEPCEPPSQYDGIIAQRAARRATAAQDLWWFAAPMRTNVNTGTLRVGLPAGNWVKVASSQGPSQGTQFRWPDVPDWNIRFNAIYREGAGTKLIYAQRPPGDRWLMQVRAWDTSDIEHAPDLSTASGRAGQNYTYYETFRNLAPHQVKEFVVQARPCEWVEFRNVALRPTPRAGTKPEAGGPAAASQTPPASQTGPLLQFRLVSSASDTNAPADVFPVPGAKPGQPPLRVLKDVLLDETAVAHAGWEWSQFGPREIQVELMEAGARRFAQITGENVGRQLAIIFRGKLLSAPVIRTAIPGGRVVIAGNFADAEIYTILDGLNRAPTPSTNRAFGPVMEQVLPRPAGTNYVVLDLDTRRRATNALFKPETEGFSRWLRAEGADVAAAAEQSSNVLTGYGLVLSPVKGGDWLDCAPAEVLNNWSLMTAKPADQSAIRMGETPSNAFMFRTREGGWGVLQIVGESENPPGVKIRYRLVQPEGKGRGVTEPGPASNQGSE